MVGISRNIGDGENSSLNITKTYLFLDNLATSTTSEKCVLDRLVRNNEKLVDQVAKVTRHFDSFASGA